MPFCTLEITSDLNNFKQFNICNLKVLYPHQTSLAVRCKRIVIVEGGTYITSPNDEFTLAQKTVLRDSFIAVKIFFTVTAVN